MLNFILGAVLAVAVVLIVITALRLRLAKLWPQWRSGSQPVTAHSTMPGIVVDTSVIIDGRIADIARAGFVPGRLLVPRFVLAELQNIADSSDAMRRGRGRRGLEVLNSLRGTDNVEVEVVDQEVAEIKEVDAKLVRLAKTLGTHILTTDYNLNRVAQIEGVRVLNVNELSNAVRPVVLPGERMLVKVVQAGKEKGQGVGYLPDGTMIVVDKGDKLIGQEVQTEITRVFQTVAGKMLFAAPISATVSSVTPPASAHPRPQADTTTEGTASVSPNGRRGNNPRYSKGRRFNAPAIAPEAKNAPVQSSQPSNPPRANAHRPQAPRRVNATQKLENSLLEMTGDVPDPR